MAHEGNKQGGGLRRVATGYGILGFVRFLDCYYCVLITQRRKVGSIGGAPIYGIKATELIRYQTRSNEIRRSLLNPLLRRGDESQIEPDAARDGGAALRQSLPICGSLKRFLFFLRV